MIIAEKNYDNKDFTDFLKALLINELYADDTENIEDAELSNMTPAEVLEYLQKDYDWSDDDLLDFFNKVYHNEGTSSIEDVNNDGDADVSVTDTNGDDEPDTAVIDADTKAEDKKATKIANEALGLDDKDKTSTGKTKEELADEPETVSDIRQKNILSALIDNRF